MIAEGKSVSARTEVTKLLRRFVDLRRPSLYEALSLVISALGLISIVLLINQTRQLSNSLESTVHQAITNQMLEVNRIFIENPDLRPYFYSGKAISPQDPNLAKALAVADLQLDFFDSFWTQSDNLPELHRDGPEWDAWNNYIGDSFRHSPIMCKRLQEVHGWYTPDFIKFAGEFCS